MRVVGAILMLGLILSACGSRTSATTSSGTPSSVITLTEENFSQSIRDTLQLGRMRQGEIIAKSIRLHNATTRPIVILREVMSCGCTTVSYSRKPIAPDTSCDISVEFNSQGQAGWQMKLLELYIAEKDTPLKIYIDAEVE